MMGLDPSIGPFKINKGGTKNIFYWILVQQDCLWAMFMRGWSPGIGPFRILRVADRSVFCCTSHPSELLENSGYEGFTKYRVFQDL